MYHLIQESGYAAWFTLLFTLAGIAATLTIGRLRGRPGTVAACFAVVILASAAAGVGTGQRAVDRYVSKLPPEDLKGRIEALSVGTREASGNHILGGMGALLVSALGGALALQAARREDRDAGTRAS